MAVIDKGHVIDFAKSFVRTQQHRITNLGRRPFPIALLPRVRETATCIILHSGYFKSNQLSVVQVDMRNITLVPYRTLSSMSE